MAARDVRRLSAGVAEDLQLDVVGIAEDDHRVGHRLVGVDDAGVLDAELVQPAGPRVQAGAVSDAERDVVKAGPALVEGLAGVGVSVKSGSFVCVPRCT
jgi:hypothetical protein